MQKDKVYIILLNYNNWMDTIECAESILKNNYENYQLIIVDNSCYAQKPKSAKITAWKPYQKYTSTF